MSNNTPHLSINKTPTGDCANDLKLAGYTESRVYRHRDQGAVVEYVSARGDKLLVHYETKSDATVFRPEYSTVESPVMTSEQFLGRKSSAYDDLMFAAAGDHEIVWLDETNENSMQVTKIMSISNDDIDDRIRHRFGDDPMDHICEDCTQDDLEKYL